jgi:hypothetical protein
LDGLNISCSDWLLVDEGIAGLDLRVERCRRVGAGHRDRHPGEHVNKRSHRQPHIPSDGGAFDRPPGADNSAARDSNAASECSRWQATNEDNRKDWRFRNMRFSVT